MLKRNILLGGPLALALISSVALAAPAQTKIIATIPNGSTTSPVFHDNSYLFYYCKTATCSGTLYPFASLYEDDAGEVSGVNGATISDPLLHKVWVEVQVKAGQPRGKLASQNDIKGTYISKNSYSVGQRNVIVSFDASPVNWVKQQ